VNLRRLRLPLLIVAVLLTAWAATALPRTVALVSAYQQTPFVRGPWGATTGQFGVAGDRLGKQQGPRSMVLDSKGNLLVADTHNDRVWRYDAKGVPAAQALITVERACTVSHVAVDGRGHVYLADGAAPLVLAYDQAGRSLGAVNLAEPVEAGTGQEGSWLLLGLWGEQGAGWFGRGRAGVYAHLVSYSGSGSQARIVHLSEPGGTVRTALSFTGPGPASASPEGVPLPETFCTGPGGQLALGFRSGPFGLRIAAYGSGGQPAWQVDLSRQAVIGGSHLIGGDRRGNFYLALEYGATAEIVRVGPRGDPEVVAGIRPFRPRPDQAGPGDAPYLTTPARVDRNGLVYVASSSVDEFVIYRLKPETMLRRK
jgi:hypothetical protein